LSAGTRNDRVNVLFLRWDMAVNPAEGSAQGRQTAQMPSNYCERKLGHWR